MCKIFCTAKTCTNYKKGECQAETINISNFSWHDEESKEDLDEMKCSTYQYNKDWMLK